MIRELLGKKQLVGIIGAGKIGKALGRLAEKFSTVVYADKTDPESMDASRFANNDINFICVNTANEVGYEMDNLLECLTWADNFNNIVIVSTCPPSAFDNEKGCLAPFVNVITYNPLFIRQGTIEEDIVNAEIVLIGSYQDCSELKKFYGNIRSDYKFYEMELQEAATVKMAINGFLTMKIAYANMIGDFCVGHDMRPDVVLEAISANKSVNPYYFKYGFGYGGPCLPIDNRTLAKELQKTLPTEIDGLNESHLDFLLMQAINEFTKEDLIVVDQVGYKSDVPILTKSQKLEFAVTLAKLGYKVKIRDTADVCSMVSEEYPGLFSFEEFK